MLRCPNCHAELKREGKAFRCRNGHSFDVARQGYVNLLVNARRETGDNKEMVSARTAFLEQGHYRCLRDALCEIIRSLPVQVIADCGCGEGYYTQAAAEEGKDVYAFDMSKYALMKCARRHPAIHALHLRLERSLERAHAAHHGDAQRLAGKNPHLHQRSGQAHRRFPHADPLFRLGQPGRKRNARLAAGARVSR